MTLEDEFLKVATVAQKEIEEKLNEASKLIREAETIAEKHGVPFASLVSPVRNQYIPISFEKKFGGIDREILEEFGVRPSGYGNWGDPKASDVGWLNSSDFGGHERGEC